MSSPYSIIDVRGLPVWWAEDGIYTVKFDANFNSTVVESLTEESIKSYILDIPELNRKYVKGAYDRLNDLIYWVFSDDSSLLSSDGPYTYNKILALNVKTKAFYPLTVTVSSETPQYIKGICYIQDGLQQSIPSIKFTTTNSTKLFFSEMYRDTYTDWELYSVRVSANADDETNYKSFFITGYRNEGQGMLNFHGIYVYMFNLPTNVQAQYKIFGIFDWTNSGNSGKWSSSQTVTVNSNTTTLRDQSVSRIKLRGKGRSMQMNFESIDGKPFKLSGWGIWASSAGTP
jgi:hypothetical protein